MWELDHKESWTPKNLCFWTVVLEKTLESPLDCKEIQPVHPKGNQSWIFIGKTGAEAEAPTLWPPDVKNGLIWKDPGAGKDWRQEKGTTEDEMVGWHHSCEGHEFEQASGVGDRQGSLTFFSLWSHKVSGTTEWLSWLTYARTFLVAQSVKNLPAMLETWVWSLSWEDPLEKGIATYSSILAWRIPWTEESGRLQSMGLQREECDWATNTFTFIWNIEYHICLQDASDVSVVTLEKIMK